MREFKLFLVDRLQEFLIIICLILALFFWVWGWKSESPVLFYVSAVFFIVIGFGVLSTGWEKYEGNFLIETIDVNTDSITPVLTTYNATMEQNPSIYAFSMICVSMTLAMVVQGIRTGNITKS